MMWYNTAMNTNKISYNKYVAEIFGTLILVLAVAVSSSLDIAGIVVAGLALAFGVYLFGDISGAHLNPAFTITALTMKKIKWQDGVTYICSQLIGAGLALIILNSIGGGSVNLTDGIDSKVLMYSEFIGSIIFSFAFAAAIHGKTTKSNVGLVLGMGLIFGVFAAKIAGGLGVLNPAVAIGINASHWVTIVMPIVGVLVGSWIYRFMALGKLCECDSNCKCNPFKKNKVVVEEIVSPDGSVVDIIEEVK